MRLKLLFSNEKEIWIWFDDVEDLINFIKARKIRTFNFPLIRFVCKEEHGNRYYYVLRCNDGAVNYVLIGANATDYSGHGSRDKKLIEEMFKWLGIKERPVSYLINLLIDKIGHEVEL